MILLSNNDSKMISNFAIAFREMGLRNWQIVGIFISAIIFPITFFISSKNFDAKSFYESMIEKNDNKN